MRRQQLMTVFAAIVLAGCSSSSGPADPTSAPPVDDSASGETMSSGETVSSGEAVRIESTGADTNRDLIRPDDPSSFVCMIDLGIETGEFYDKDADQLLFDDNAHFFEARYSDGSTVEIRVHSGIIGPATAAAQAERISAPLGLLPTELLSGVERVGFLAGQSTAQADGGGEGIHVYESNVARRESTNRFEETLFHESVHTSLDDRHATSPEWAAARDADGAFLTDYASEQPEREDLAETALYAWALVHHPERISAADADAWNAAVPNRIAYVASILSPPGEEQSAAPVSC